MNAQAFLQAAKPVAADLLFYTSISRFTSPGKAFALSTLAGSVTIILFCSRTRVDFATAAVVYIAFKTAHFFCTQIKTPKTTIFEETPDMSKEQWSPEKVADCFKALSAKATCVFEGVLNFGPKVELLQIVQEIQKHPGFSDLRAKARNIWNSPKMDQMAAHLMQGAMAEMYKLMFDLRYATADITDKEERNRQMAALLKTQPYLKRFIPSNSPLFFVIYRFIRCRKYIIDCPHLQSINPKVKKQIKMIIKPSDADEALFLVEGSDKDNCRKFYNRIVDLYLPLIPYLPPKLSAWFVKDEGRIPPHFLYPNYPNRTVNMSHITV